MLWFCETQLSDLLCENGESIPFIKQFLMLGHIYICFKLMKIITIYEFTLLSERKSRHLHKSSRDYQRKSFSAHLLLSTIRMHMF